MEHPRIEHLYFVSIWGEIGWWQLIFSGEIEKKSTKDFRMDQRNSPKSNIWAIFIDATIWFWMIMVITWVIWAIKIRELPPEISYSPIFKMFFCRKKFRKYRYRNDFRMIVSNYLSLCTIKISNSIWTILFSWGQPEFCSHSLKF